MNFLLITLILPVFAEETRIRVGSQRWAFEIITSDGNIKRREFVDENGISRGYISVTSDAIMRKVEYKFDVTKEEPDFTFAIKGNQTAENEDPVELQRVVKREEGKLGNESSDEISTDRCEVCTEASQLSLNEDKEAKEGKSASAETSSSAVRRKEVKEEKEEPLNFDSINDEKEFEGHVTLKVDHSSYLIKLLSGDQSRTRDEALDSNGVVFGKYVYMSSDNRSQTVIDYKFNASGVNPTFEVSMFKRYDRPQELESVTNQLRFFNPTKITRKFLLPLHYNGLHAMNRELRGLEIPKITIHSQNPSHSIITPTHGQWHYKVH